ncbi:carnitine O-acetyltransferase [Cryptococcus neoformans C23]|uniref:Carnitine O-acetyltransferase, mitochondrial n=1 Tax=Cryptococcus neoformans (strain H99 / ATCC 208821 / CBS 10515 / FGSC 9487) TaxID=235443 RepID=J9VJ92_CRYN9|nr:carnitine O-acetyltransferase [Cryptococcus neoformans var. grubii H99]AFR92669.1 carnitine O-acetyltransferase [Cryptococcus neoformans var. grubii H99]AUB22125.1 carnitine O-acetyltransferase [Cryptococcus neoformans var. grubii]OWZ48124.1 carnitine O-acetyltransferase [Cryptococcus neoformans var. grubii C23]|eukprot:XP_012046788.1 carnitine O-acetyltransferase [Cryptococcus neoformans var. grubii H99]
MPIRSSIFAQRALSQLKMPISTSKRTVTNKPLYASQSTIPHLPVPPLSSTLHKYLETLSPLLSQSDLSQSASVVKAFAESDQAKVLQQRLKNRAQEKDSWLSEWWNEAAYMSYRGRIIPNVSYFYLHKKGLGKGKSQENRAAELVRATVEFKKLVDSELLEPEKIKGQPLCMASYKYLFNSARQPNSPSDFAKAYGPDNYHIVVLRNNRYFKVDTYGRGAKELAEAFKKIKVIADREPGPNVGVLTADNRDVWTSARNQLFSLSPANKSTVETIDSAILLICLDAHPAPTTDDSRAWSYWAGGHDNGKDGMGFNRWFDKHEIIVDSEGESGFNGEHSMLDGTPTLRLNEFILASIDSQKIPLELDSSETSRYSTTEPEELKFELDDKLKQIVEQSKRGFEEEMEKQDLKMVTFREYGKNLIKTYRTSPDAWAQLIFQLAFYRLFQRLPATYESCQTRKFLLGRTEVIRSASNEGKAWVEAMINESFPEGDEGREKLFRKAVERHVQYAVWAADAQGVDRHLFGLKKLIAPGEPTPEIFSDPAFARSSHWELSTSNLGSRYLDGWGYGEVVEDGFGLSYSIEDDALRWGITKKKGPSGAGASAAELGQALESAAREVASMMERAKNAKTNA